MKIILSPSKTQDFSLHGTTPMTVPLFEAQAFKLNNLLKRQSKKSLKDLMGLEGERLQATRQDIKDFADATPKPAITTYTGLVFKYFDLTAYGPEALAYLNSHLRILSAHYGVLRPSDGIRPYRLDMTMKPDGKNLYAYWQKALDGHFDAEETIIDLASSEFSKMVRGHKITVGFRDFKDGQYKNLATYAKMARGMLLHQMVLNKTDSVEALKGLTFDTYGYNGALSTDTLILFTREAGNKKTT